MKATKITPTEELLTSLAYAQAAHTASILTNPYNRMADDWGDYTNSALDVMRALFDMRWDQEDLTALGEYLNTPQSEADKHGYIECGTIGKVVHLGLCASDGICEALYNLNCIAMED